MYSWSSQASFMPIMHHGSGAATPVLVVSCMFQHNASWNNKPHEIVAREAENT
jgi:hypothetical protein